VGGDDNHMTWEAWKGKKLVLWEGSTKAERSPLRRLWTFKLRLKCLAIVKDGRVGVLSSGL
jgi:hypothetical protein